MKIQEKWHCTLMVLQMQSIGRLDKKNEPRCLFGNDRYKGFIWKSESVFKHTLTLILLQPPLLSASFFPPTHSLMHFQQLSSEDQGLNSSFPPDKKPCPCCCDFIIQLFLLTIDVKYSVSQIFLIWCCKQTTDDSKRKSHHLW